MSQDLDYKQADHPINFAAFDEEAERVATAVNHIIRVNSSSAFPMPRPKEKSSIIGRIAQRFKA